jgi:L,D-transpeptidase catalytic domain
MQSLMRHLALPALTAVAALVALSVADPAAAQRSPEARRGEVGLSRPAGAPLMAVVSLGQQRVTIYDADGKILQAPVSTGQKGYETPAGIYSVLEKNREHYSNLYDDASMPFMQRLTWSGIALHAGVLPGYPASHGCIRMPHAFAEQLFEITRLGLRVIVVRDDMRPVEIAHPALFKPGPIRSEVALAQGAGQPAASLDPGSPPSSVHLATAGTAGTLTWRAFAAHKATAAEAAAKVADEARRVAHKAGAEAAKLTRAVRLAEGAKLRADMQLQEAERALEMASSPEAAHKAEETKTKAQERFASAQAQLDAAIAEGQPKIDAAAVAREEAKTAEAVRIVAQSEAKSARAKLAPVSVFISRKAQRLYARQALQPIFESPVTISNPDEPIGTVIFTATEHTDDGTGVRWSALSMYPDGANPGPAPGFEPRRHANRYAEPARTNVQQAKVALERISIPDDVIGHISELLSPGSSLIISDEALSRETGKGTDFVVVMSGEPQGGIKIRRRASGTSRGYDRRWRVPTYRPYFW